MNDSNWQSIKTNCNKRLKKRNYLEPLTGQNLKLKTKVYSMHQYICSGHNALVGVWWWNVDPMFNIASMSATTAKHGKFKECTMIRRVTLK